MLFKQSTLSAIQAGRVGLVFRRWQSARVKAGSKVLTAKGQLEIKSVAVTTLSGLSENDVEASEFETLQELKSELRKHGPGKVYRIAIGGFSVDPRIALRNSQPSATELQNLRLKLEAMDKRGTVQWTHAVLNLIADKPGVRAGDLCSTVAMEKAQFKTNVRKLKNLGLTESLGTGYKLSPRGKAVLRFGVRVLL